MATSREMWEQARQDAEREIAKLTSEMASIKSRIGRLSAAAKQCREFRDMGHPWPGLVEEVADADHR